MPSRLLWIPVSLMAVSFLSLPLVGLRADEQGGATEKDEGAVDATPLLMRAKLTSSQKILEGLVTKDFKLIGTGADELVRLSDAAAFKRSRDAVYDHFSHDFRRQAQKLGKLADRGNIDGVTFTYMRMTNSCVTCHDYMRDVLKLTDKKEEEDGAIRLLQNNKFNAN